MCHPYGTALSDAEVVKIDLTLPFIAIRCDVEGDDFTPTMGEYLCNPLTEDLLDAEVSIGGFYSDPDLGVISSEPKSPDRYTVPAGKYVRFALSTWDEYCEMVCHWSLSYRTESLGQRTSKFGTFKRLEDVTSMDDVPILGGGAMIVPGEVSI